MRSIVLIVTGLLVCFASLNADERRSSADRMLTDVKYLASDDLEGRGIGTDGLAKAADYIAESFQAARLNVSVAGGDPFQEFEVLDGAELDGVNRLALIAPDGTRTELQMGQDFEVCSFGDSGKFNTKLVFAGYGIDAEEQKYNDFENIDISGAVVVILRRNPQQSNPHGPFAVGHGVSRHAALTTKVSQAYARGAAGILFVNDPFSARDAVESLTEQLEHAEERVLKSAEFLAEKPDDPELLKELQAGVTHLHAVREELVKLDRDPLMKFGYAGTRSGASVPVFQITQEVCNRMLSAATGKTLVDLEKAIDETGVPVSKEIPGWTVEGQTSVKVIRRPTSNVVGILEGEGPLRNETIVIGAHFDHLGYGGEGSLSPGSKEIHNGADDNASGTAGLLELARRFGARKERLPRRLVLIAFSGEERGLLGSAEYVKAPLYPLESTVAMFNMDMIGRLEGDDLTVFGTGTSSRWEKLIDEAAKQQGLSISKKPEGFGPSDHSSFYAKKIPVLHLFTGTHDNYHRPSDDWELINAEGMSRVIDFLESMIVDTASQDARPDYVQIAGKADIDRGGSRPYFGSIPDFSSDAPGYSIQGVSPESPADKGGLKGGDVIIRLGGAKVGSLDDFDLALRKFKPGQEVDVVVLRDGQEVNLKVTLAAPRGG